MKSFEPHFYLCSSFGRHLAKRPERSKEWVRYVLRIVEDEHAQRMGDRFVYLTKDPVCCSAEKNEPLNVSLRKLRVWVGESAAPAETVSTPMAIRLAFDAVSHSTLESSLSTKLATGIDPHVKTAMMSSSHALPSFIATPVVTCVPGASSKFDTQPSAGVTLNE